MMICKKKLYPIIASRYPLAFLLTSIDRHKKPPDKDQGEQLKTLAIVVASSERNH